MPPDDAERVSMVWLRLRAAKHEVRCAECRVTWPSWLARALGVGGMSPKVM